MRQTVGVGKEERRGADPDDVLFIDGVIDFDGDGRRRSVRKVDFGAVHSVLVSHRDAI